MTSNGTPMRATAPQLSAGKRPVEQPNSQAARINGLVVPVIPGGRTLVQAPQAHTSTVPQRPNTPPAVSSRPPAVRGI